VNFERIATGFCFLEAPRVDGRGVWFSDLMLGGVRCLGPSGEISEWLTTRKMIGGIAFNEDGTLVCSGQDGLVWLNPKSGESGPFLHQIEGKPISGINDINPDGHGGLYFATVDHPALLRGEKPAPSTLYRLDAAMHVTELRSGLAFGNGIGLSPDGKRLYHAETWAGTYAYELRADGSLGEATRLNELHDCDGLAVDQEGGVWFASFGSGTIIRVEPNGKIDQQISIPGGLVTSLCFGGPDWQNIYVTTGSPGVADAIQGERKPLQKSASIFRARADVPGVPVRPTRFRIGVH
jgi:D-xylonolactonase